MNIFKVIATADSTFREKFTSTIIAWLLNPSMEHGLGYSFTQLFVESLNIGELDQLSSLLKTSFANNDDDNSIDWQIKLEFNVGNVFIDIVVIINEWIFVIENKIYNKSHMNGQLQKEYGGIKNNEQYRDYKVVMIYLVPIVGDLLDSKILNEFEELYIEKNDYKTIVTWQENDVEYNSVSWIISEIIRKESLGDIDPIFDYTRHTIKAFRKFINDNFQGYEKGISSRNNSSEEYKRFNISKLKSLGKGFVGYNDLNWILNLNKEKLKTYKFKYTENDMSSKIQWIDLRIFNNLCDFCLDKDNYQKIDWASWNTVSSKSIAQIAEKYKYDFFIGIRGGLEGLKKLSLEELKKKRWQISNECKSKEWINKESYLRIISQKE